jgi:hypothetical protein
MPKLQERLENGFGPLGVKRSLLPRLKKLKMLNV